MNYSDFIKYNTSFETYGKAVKVNKRLIVGAYTILAIIVPVVVPVFLAPIINKLLPDTIRYGG